MPPSAVGMIDVGNIAGSMDSTIISMSNMLKHRLGFHFVVFDNMFVAPFQISQHEFYRYLGVIVNDSCLLRPTRYG